VLPDSHDARAILVVGLILGTRMWYSMWDAENDDDASFERRVDQVLREVGERGKPVVSESVPPERRPKRAGQTSSEPVTALRVAPAPAPALAPRALEPEHAGEQSILPPRSSEPKARPAVTTAQTTAATPTDQTFTPTVQHHHQMASSMASSEAAQGYGGVGSGGMIGPSFCELMSLIRERDAEVKGERAESEARLESQRRETERQRQQFEELRLGAEREKVKQIQRKLYAEQVAGLQSRLEALHSTQLLTVSTCI
jgi:hypothetical protein